MISQARGHFERAVGIPAEALSSYRRVHSQSNIWLADESPFRQKHATIRGSQIAGEEKVKASPFYNEWLRPIGLLNTLLAVLSLQRFDPLTLLLAGPGRRPWSRSTRRTQLSSVCGVQPIFGAIEPIVAYWEEYS